MTPHYLDWESQPTVYKDYPGIDPISLPSNVRPAEEKLSSLLKERKTDQPGKGIDVENLSLILRLTCSLTAKARHAGGDFYYRSVASAGALYPTEIYVATHALNGLDDGLYHFAIRHHGLFPLRVHDLSPCIVEISQPPERKAPILTFFLTAIFSEVHGNIVNDPIDMTCLIPGIWRKT